MNKNNKAIVQAAGQVVNDARPDLALLAELLPAGVMFTQDIWNVEAWGAPQTRPMAFNLSFDRISNPELRDATKIILLIRRMERSIGPGRASIYIHVAQALSQALGARSITRMTSGDAHQAAKILLGRSHTYLPTLATFVAALRRTYGVGAQYKAPKTAAARHGTKGTDAGRKEKRIDDSILRSLLATLRHRELADDDRLFFSAIAFNLACGWRAGELLTLPKDCLFWDEGALYVRGFPSKNGKVAPKLIAPALAPMVEEAHDTIVKITDLGRSIAKAWPSEDNPDWRTVLKDEKAVLYYAQKILHRWGSTPEHRLINPDAAWSRDHGWLDILGAIDEFPSVRQAHLALGIEWATFNDLKKQQIASREGKIWTRKPNRSQRAWMRDGRVCDKHTLFKLMGMATGQKHHTKAIIALVAEAFKYQKKGGTIPLPKYNAKMEAHFRRERPRLLEDASGNSILYVEDALFVTQRGFIGSQSKKTDDWQLVSVYHLFQWLNGTTARASAFERHKILDPETGKIAKFTSHQIRHWLDTQLHKGGLSDAQIATLMNRRDISGNSVYNQMSNRERRAKVEEGIHNGIIGGIVAEVVKRADVTRDEADDILASRLRQINVMPHGLCLKDLATEPCPHHMSCFSAETNTGENGACNHLLVDGEDAAQMAALQREHSNAKAVLEMFLDDPELERSPQIAHFQTIFETTRSLLKERKR